MGKDKLNSIVKNREFPLFNYLSLLSETLKEKMKIKKISILILCQCAMIVEDYIKITK